MKLGEPGAPSPLISPQQSLQAINGGFWFPYRLEIRLVRMLGTMIEVATTPFKLAGEPLEVTNWGS